MRAGPILSLKAVRPIFTDNIGLKLFSLLCALIIYAFVHGTQEAQRTVAVDLVVLLPPTTANRALVTPLPTSVRVTVTGPRSLVDGLRPEDLGNFQVDLRTARSGRVQLEASMLQLPPGLSLSTVDPPALEIAWDDVVERDIPLHVPISGEPVGGSMVKGPPVPEPRTVHARGPKQVVEALQSVRTEAFDVSGLTDGTHQRTVAVETSPTRVTYDLPTVSATLEITRRLTEVVFRKVPVHVVGHPRAQAFPAHVDVRVVGPPEVVRELRSEQIVPRIDLKDVTVSLATPNSVALPLRFDIEGCTVSIVPATVVVKW